MSLAVIDIGGTSIKFAGYTTATGLFAQTRVATPKTLAAFYHCLQQQVAALRQITELTGVAISSPGVVDQAAGVIRGASAVPYIHHFPIVTELSNRLHLPLTIENDANCAALAEAQLGAAADVRDAILLVLGTGVGGAVIINGQLHRGRHLMGGEFGYMLHGDEDTVSHLGTLINTVARYNRQHGTQLDGKRLYELAQSGDSAASTAMQKMFHVLAVTIFNLQYSFDPDCFVISGGISQNPALLGDLEAALDEMMANTELTPIRPVIRIAKFQAEANLYGAAVHFYQQHQAGLIPLERT
ncbi:ROK family protein [Lacticaseibacillus chiayiensis]|uniref:ROK family protein n=1 Tax=Lacticaseibacillus chiayiensis TaxID=2100821 RepID=UPI001011E812|nr:ROK family protein [Lacticaseibacillus chiayiensis]RXT57918.1 N-acetylmannosamine kinase [Lacticaseibacillus chiayiensis]